MEAGRGWKTHSRHSTVINRVERILPFRSDKPSQGRAYRHNISDDEVEDDNGSTAPGDADALFPWDNAYQTSNLDVSPHLPSTEYSTQAATRGNASLVAPGDAPAPRETERQRSSLDVPSTVPSAWTEYTERVATHKNNPAYECAYIVRNISRVEDEISENSLQIDRLQCQPPHLRSVVGWMKNRLNDAKRDSVYQDMSRSFIPCTKLYAIMNEYTVQRALEELVEDDETRSSRAEIKRLTQSIAPSIHELAKANEAPAQFRRVFAVLAMIGKAECIFNFIRQGVDDTYICNRGVAFEIPEDDNEEELEEAYARFPGPCQDRSCWSKQDIRDLRDKRWEVSPPFFSIHGFQGEALESGIDQPRRHKPALVHYELRSSDVIVPFLKEKRKPATNGAFSQLEFYRLHEDQHEGKRYTVGEFANF